MGKEQGSQIKFDSLDISGLFLYFFETNAGKWIEIWMIGILSPNLKHIILALGNGDRFSSV